MFKQNPSMYAESEKYVPLINNFFISVFIIWAALFVIALIFVLMGFCDLNAAIMVSFLIALITSFSGFDTESRQHDIEERQKALNKRFLR